MEYFRNVAHTLSLCGLTIEELKMTELCNQVDRIQALSVGEERTELQKLYIQKLKELCLDLKEAVYKDLSAILQVSEKWIWLKQIDKTHVKDVNDAKNRILNSYSVKVISEVADLLSELKYAADSEHQDKEKVQQFAQKHQKMQRKNVPLNFMKSLLSVLSAGIGFILGIPAGMLFGCCYGTVECSRGGFFYEVPHWGYYTAIEGAKTGNKIAKSLLFANPKHQSTSRSLLFKPPLIESDLLETAGAAAEFIKYVKK